LMISSTLLIYRFDRLSKRVIGAWGIYWLYWLAALIGSLCLLACWVAALYWLASLVGFWIARFIDSCIDCADHGGTGEYFSTLYI